MDRLTPKISFHVKARVPTTLEDAVQLAKRFESLLPDVSSTMFIHGSYPYVHESQVNHTDVPRDSSDENTSSKRLQDGSVPHEDYQGQGDSELEDVSKEQYFGNNDNFPYHGYHNDVQCTTMIPLQGQPIPYYQVPYQVCNGQQPVYWNQPPPLMMIPTQQPMTPNQQSGGGGQVPSTFSLAALPSSPSSTWEKTVAELERKLNESEKRCEALLERHNALFERVYNSNVKLLSVKYVA